MLPMGAMIAHEWSPPKSWVSLGYYRASFPSWLPCTLIAFILAWFLHLHVLLVAGILDIFPFQRNMETVWRYCWLRGSFSVGCQWRYQCSLLHSARRKERSIAHPSDTFRKKKPNQEEWNPSWRLKCWSFEANLIPQIRLQLVKIWKLRQGIIFAEEVLWIEYLLSFLARGCNVELCSSVVNS